VTEGDARACARGRGHKIGDRGRIPEEVQAAYNSRATLGTMLGHMRGHSDDFRLMLPAPGVPITSVIGMMTALWEGQTSRHGAQNPTRPETIAEARAAIHLAVVLVHWFSTGIVRRSTDAVASG
jgi:hypothetical protein